MTFVSHKFAGGSLHLFLAALFLWLFSMLLAAAGGRVPPLVVLALAYGAYASGSRFGGFPDTEDWVTNLIGLSPRWAVYTRCHVGDLYEKFKWIPAWFYHIFCDRFAHPPKDTAGNPVPPKWWQMDPAWRDKHVIFGWTLWDIHYVAREAIMDAVAVMMLWMSSAILLSVAHIVLVVYR